MQLSLRAGLLVYTNTPKQNIYYIISIMAET